MTLCPDDIGWQLSAFDDLKPSALYAILRLRAEVFQIEQNCLYLDIDGRDAAALHLMGWGRDEGDQPILCASARLFLPQTLGSEGLIKESVIGRVITSSAMRGTGLGHVLMERAIEALKTQAPESAIRISAQAHLQAFYARHGFQAVGDIYDEDGIPHIKMIKN